MCGSSLAVYGLYYPATSAEPEYLPVDEGHPRRPQDPYGLSKVVGEQIADSVALLHADMTISSLRFPGVVFDFSYNLVRERWKSPGARANTSWAYIDGRDAASACRLAIEAEFAGHEVMIVAAPTSSMREPTVELIGKYLDKEIPVRTADSDNWSGVTSAKAGKMLGFKARYGWENSLAI